MRSTRKKVIKTVYKDENDSEEETGDFSDSGSEAHITEQSSSEDENEPIQSSSDEFIDKSKRKSGNAKRPVKKTKFAKNFISKINKNIDEDLDDTPSMFSVKDLTEADKLLPSVLNLSESDSSDDESVKPHQKKSVASSLNTVYEKEPSSDSDSKVEYKDVWSCNVQENSEEIANKAFQQLEQHKNRIDKTKASIQNYAIKKNQIGESDVNDLLALGEEVLAERKPTITSNRRKKTHASDSEHEEWEEVKESKTIPPQGLQLIVDIPNACCRKKKSQDVEMMMKRKINRVKKEYQIYMHKVHVLCWLAHGNYVSCVLNDQKLMIAALSLVPSKDCYPKDRVDMKYVEQVTQWYHDKMTIKQDKYENKFKPKAPPLIELLLDQIKKRKASTKKYLVFIFVSMLRALGLQCRIMFNFVTLPIKPPSSELCSLSTKTKLEKSSDAATNQSSKVKKVNNDKIKKKTSKSKIISQVDGNCDISFSSDSENIMQVDGNDDSQEKSMSTRTRARKAKDDKNDTTDVSPPKRLRRSPHTKASIDKTPVRKTLNKKETVDSGIKKTKNKSQKETQDEHILDVKNKNLVQLTSDTNTKTPTPRITKPSPKVEKRVGALKTLINKSTKSNDIAKKIVSKVPVIIITNEDNISSKYFDNEQATGNKKNVTLKRKRSTTVNPSNDKSEDKVQQSQRKLRTKSAPGNMVNKSEYFTDKRLNTKTIKLNLNTKNNKTTLEESQRVSHKDLTAKSKVTKNDVTSDLIGIIKNRVREAKAQAKRGVVKGKQKEEIDEDSDYLSEEPEKCYKSDEDFKPKKISPRPSTSRKPIDRRVLSSDEETPKNKCDVWCEIFVEELEQWVSVDVVNAKVHCTSALYSHSTHPVCYIVGWDNNNKLKDLTRRYVPHWNTVTRKQRAETQWWNKAVSSWLGPRNARDKEEDEQLDRMQLEAPLPKSISEYKNHPLYVLKRHLLKFEVIYPPDAATLGFVRNDPVYARECVYVCRSRDTWLKEAKVVRLGEKPYKVVKARPKWDRLSNKLITDKMLEVFGPWQVQDYEPPVAENGMVPRNAYGNVELFKDCMLPKGTVHIKLPGLNKVARKLNIDCAPAMTGFDFNGGWSHPVYDGFVVCQEFEEIITEAWLKDQEDQERKEREKTEARVYGNWKRLIKGLFIRERLKSKYGFEEPSTNKAQQKSKGPRLVVKKKS